LLEHVADPWETCLGLSRALVPGGILKISVPDGRAAERIISRLKSAPSEVTDAEWMPIQPLEHVNCFTSRSIDQLARRAGLAVVFPTVMQRYVFLTKASAIPRRPKQLVKEMIRPFYTFRNSTNLYRWLRADQEVRGQS